LKQIVFIVTFFTCWFVYIPAVYSQDDISLSSNWYNRANYNPASIAREDYLYLFSSVQKQWLGVDGSPTVFSFQASQYYYNLHSAFGISVVNDHLALTNSINPMLTYAYRISGKSDWSLSMGLSAGVFSRSIDGSLFEPGSLADPALYYNLNTTIRPDVNTGIEFQSSRFLFGLSATHLFSFATANNLFLNSGHLYSYFMYRNTDAEILNYNVGAQVIKGPILTVLEGNASIRFKKPTGLSSGAREIFDIGLSYRTSHQLILLLGLNIDPTMRIGYAYNQSFTVGFSANPSHEIILEYRIPSKVSSACNCQNESYWY